MSKTVPWNSALESVYHDNTDCALGRDVAAMDRAEGSAGKKCCAECERLDHAERSLHRVLWWDSRRAVNS